MAKLELPPNSVCEYCGTKRNLSIKLLDGYLCIICDSCLKKKGW